MSVLSRIATTLFALVFSATLSIAAMGLVSTIEVAVIWVWQRWGWIGVLAVFFLWPTLFVVFMQGVRESEKQRETGG